LEEATPFRIDGVYCRLIPLTKGFHAIVDASDYEALMQRRWQTKSTKWGFYVIRNTGKKKKKLSMHRVVLPTVRGLDPDHINGVGLDNRRNNLRPATIKQNHRNTRRYRNNKSGFKGVRRGKNAALWMASITVDGKEIYLGQHATKELAAEAYRAAAFKYFGEFARFE
jgi:hypothetical protein